MGVAEGSGKGGAAALTGDFGFLVGTNCFAAKRGGAEPAKRLQCAYKRNWYHL